MSHMKEIWAYGIVRDGKRIAVEYSEACAKHWVDAEIVPLSPMRERDELLAAVEAIEINSEECLDFDECTAMLVDINDYHRLIDAAASVKCCESK